LKGILQKISRVLRKFNVQLVVTLFFAAVIPVAVTHVANHAMETKIIMDRNNALLNDNLILSRNNANTVIYNYQKALYQIVTDDAFINYMDDILEMDADSSLYTRTMEKIQQRIWANVIMYPDIQAVGFVDINNRKTMITRSGNNDLNIIDFFQANANRINDEMIFRTFPKLEVILSEDPFYSDKQSFFYISHRTFNHETMKILGTVIIFIHPDSLNKTINNSNQAIYPFSNKIILTGDDRILSSKNNRTGSKLSEIPEALLFLQSRDKKIPVFENNHTLIQKTDIDGFDLYLLDIVNKNALLSDMRKLWVFTSLAILVVMTVTLFIVYYVSRNSILSINRITDLMNSLAKDNLDVAVTQKSNNEIRSIEVAFEQMVDRIKKLLSENEQQYQRILEVTRASREAELKSLELQINPHFLFNTIDTINWMAIRKGEYDISAQLNSLASILRYTVYDVNGVSSVEQELEWIREYLVLQQNRFRYNFDYVIDASPESIKCKIHKLILQPFLENSIVHGFENIDYKGLISIRVFTRELNDISYLVIEAADNGIGIDDGKARSIEKLLKSPHTESAHEVGIQNIALRLMGYYGESSWIDFFSMPGNTCFTLNIPQERTVSYVPDSYSRG
jgi:two-component system sensor histidine kinase YesM